MAPQPFIGVCGLQDSPEFIKLLHRAPAALKGTGRFLMVGVKEVTDDVIIQGKHDLVRPFVHCTLTEEEPFESMVLRKIQQSRGFVRGLQLNVLPWMEVDYAPFWSKLKDQYPDIVLMLQAHRITMEQYTPEQIATRVRDLPIDYILFDPSQSRGIGYNPLVMRSYVDAVYRVRPEIGVAVAGGLGTSAMSTLFAPLVQEYPALSCDAFGLLQDPIAHKLSWPRVDDYLSSWKNSLPEPVVTA